MSCPRRGMAERFHEIVFSTSAPVSTESVNFVGGRALIADCMLTSFASSKFWVGYGRKALKATCTLWNSPRQTSVNPPDAAAMVPCFSSPAESTTEVGSCPTVLHTFPNAVTDFAFCLSIVGYAFAGAMKHRPQEKEE